MTRGQAAVAAPTCLRSVFAAHWRERQRAPFPWVLVALAGGALAGVAAVIVGLLRVLPLLEDTTVGFDAPHLKAHLRIVI